MKKTMKKIISTILAVALLITLLPATGVQAATVKINKKSASIYVGETLELKLSGAKSVSWSSSNKKVATVTSKGVVKGIKKGTCKVTGKDKKTGKKYTCSVTVKALKSFNMSEENIWMASSGRWMLYENANLMSVLVGATMTIDGNKQILTKNDLEFDEGSTQIYIGKPCEPGMHTVSFSKKGYKTVTFSLECEGIEISDGPVDGVYLSEDEAGFYIILNPCTIGKHAVITVNDEEIVNGVITEDDANGDGFPIFWFGVDEPGEYKVVIKCEGYDDYETTVEYTGEGSSDNSDSIFEELSILYNNQLYIGLKNDCVMGKEIGVVVNGRDIFNGVVTEEQIDGDGIVSFLYDLPQDEDVFEVVIWVEGQVVEIKNISR